jgi:hypothetical protein
MGGNREINPLATIFASGIWEGRPPCRPVPLRHLLLAFGRDDLRVVRYRCDICFWAFGRDDLRVVRYRCDIRFWHLGGMTSVSSGTAAIFASGIWEG